MKNFKIYLLTVCITFISLSSNATFLYRKLHNWDIHHSQIKETSEGNNLIISRNSETDFLVSVISRRGDGVDFEFKAEYEIYYATSESIVSLAKFTVNGNDFASREIIYDKRLTIRFPKELLLNEKSRGRIYIKYNIPSGKKHSGEVDYIGILGTSSKSYGVMWDDEINKNFPIPVDWGKYRVNTKKSSYVIVDTLHYRNSNAILRPGQTIQFPYEMNSPNGRFSMVFQEDGNIYLGDKVAKKVLWDSGSFKQFGRSRNYQLVFQDDGNLILTAKPTSQKPGVMVWSTDNLHVKRNDANYNNVKFGFYVLQDDGNFVLYYPWDFNSNKMMVIASTNTYNGASPHFNKIK
ncbi:hypothetical protein MUB18_14085 [Sphingobacterium sp. PCS056]|uniref:hypothetical protein n=1 Tax=Sphingobacterium TaxID=28453 RepID=UPI00200BCFAD|nr:hypothetical protein [Sphingobacterium sp. PCS056]UPZ35234.1 hypothetical protein MUB18_14085 [Sphingobacterium sp. PCS056]